MLKFTGSSRFIWGPIGKSFAVAEICKVRVRGPLKKKYILFAGFISGKISPKKNDVLDHFIEEVKLSTPPQRQALLKAHVQQVQTGRRKTSFPQVLKVTLLQKNSKEKHSKMPFRTQPEGSGTDTQRGVLSGKWERNLRSKTWWFTEFCNSHYVSHFAAFFIVART